MTQKTSKKSAWKKKTLGSLLIVALLFGAHQFATANLAASSGKIANKTLADFIQNSIAFGDMGRLIHLNALLKKGEGRFEAQLGLNGKIDREYRDQLSQYLQQYAVSGGDRVTQVTFKGETFLSTAAVQGLVGRNLLLFDLLAAALLLFVNWSLLSGLKKLRAKRVAFAVQREEELQTRIVDLKQRVQALTSGGPRAEKFKGDLEQLEKEIKGINHLWGSSIDEVQKLRRQVHELKNENTSLRTEMQNVSRQRQLLEKEFSQNIRTKFREESTRNLDLL